MFIKALDFLTKLWLLTVLLLIIGGIFVVINDIPEEERIIKEWQLFIFFIVGVVLFIADQYLNDRAEGK